MVRRFVRGRMRDAGGARGTGRTARPSRIHLVGVGAIIGTTNPAGNEATLGDLTIGASLSLRFDRLVIGASADAAAAYTHDETFLAGHVGWVHAGDNHRITLLGEAGRHTYSSLRPGEDYLVDETSTPVSLPFVGLRLILDTSTATRGSFVMGWWLSVRQDLDRSNVDVNGFGDDPQVGTWRVGGTFIAAGLRIGFDTGSVVPTAPTDRSCSSVGVGKNGRARSTFTARPIERIVDRKVFEPEWRSR